MMNLGLKAQIRAELFRCALAGDFLTYTEFYNRIKPNRKMGNFPWQTHFDAIAREERSNGYPDITFMVYRANTKYPAQIDFRGTNLKDANQLASLRHGTDTLIAVYCPGKPNPY